MIFLPLLAVLNSPVDASQLTLAPGHRIEVAAQAENVRQLALAADGTLFGGSRRAGNVYAFVDADQDGVYEQTRVIASGLNMPSGIAVKGNDLYVAEVSRIWRYPDILPLQNKPAKAELFFADLPDKRHHGWKYLKFSPDGDLYFNIGAPCNICLSELPFATLARLDRNHQLHIVAKGVRNSVGFTWHPQNGQLWFTDNGRDHLGDDQPSDELNRLEQPGQHFGYPFVHANGIADPLFGQQSPSDTALTPPVFELGAHVAPLGLTFYNGNQLPQANSDTLFIAEHGSWNRSRKVGYRVVRLQTANGQVKKQDTLVDGWLVGERHWGRPNDVLVDHDGSVLISDDYAGVIYRVSRSP